MKREKDSMKAESDWCYEFASENFEDLILPERIWSPLMRMLQAREYTHLLFVGPAGIGKTATARVIGMSKTVSKAFRGIGSAGTVGKIG